MRPRGAVVFSIIVLAVMGCGRKLPPLPPEEPDPVEIVSVDVSQGEVTVTVRCAAPGGEVILLGKPNDDCPACTDDLIPKDAVDLREPGEIMLKDSSPVSEYMVYRVSLTFKSSQWLTEPRVVRF
ncbi:MAG TPA: hypothetical protein ENN34_13705 [Deltaproteobacteria bacterium]|nr:hypothetical protein [Deltaproteobacteria bacterium]